MRVQPEFFAFDTETSGLDPSKHQILSIGMVLLSADLTPICDKLIHAFPDSHGEVDEEAVRVNGYTYDKWQELGAVTQQEMFKQIQYFLSRYRRLKQVAHNLQFDRRFLEALFTRFAKAPRDKLYNDLFSFHGIDTIGIAMFTDMVIHNKLRMAYRLEKLTEAYHVPHDDAHTALSDVHATVNVLRAMRDSVRKSGGVAPAEVGQMENALLTCLNQDEQVWMFSGGKHSGKFVKDVFEEEPSYIHFVMRFPDLSDKQRAFLQTLINSPNQSNA